MENRDLMQDLVETWGEEAQLNMVIEKSLELAVAIQKFKKVEHKEDYLEYSHVYNDVCEKLADMKLMIEQSEFLFNSNEIHNHYEIKVQHLKQALNEF